MQLRSPMLTRTDENTDPLATLLFEGFTVNRLTVYGAVRYELLRKDRYCGYAHHDLGTWRTVDHEGREFGAADTLTEALQLVARRAKELKHPATLDLTAKGARQ